MNIEKSAEELNESIRNLQIIFYNLASVIPPELSQNIFNTVNTYLSAEETVISNRFEEIATLITSGERPMPDLGLLQKAYQEKDIGNQEFISDTVALNMAILIRHLSRIGYKSDLAWWVYHTNNSHPLYLTLDFGEGETLH